MLPLIAETAMPDFAHAEEMPVGVADARASQDFTPDTRLGEVMDHPAFSGFAEHLMPRPGGTYDREMPLRDFGRLLPYHSNVDADEIAASLERIADDVE